MHDSKGKPKKVSFVQEGLSIETSSSLNTSSPKLLFGSQTKQQVLFEDIGSDDETDESSNSILNSVNSVSPTSLVSPSTSPKEKYKIKASLHSGKILLQGADKGDFNDREEVLTKISCGFMMSLFCIILMCCIFDHNALAIYRGGHNINKLLEVRGFNGKVQSNGLQLSRNMLQHLHLIKDVTEVEEWQQHTVGPGHNSSLLLHITSPLEDSLVNSTGAEVKLEISGAAMSPSYYDTLRVDRASPLETLPAKLGLKLDGVPLRLRPQSSQFDVRLSPLLQIGFGLEQFGIQTGVHVLEVDFTLECNAYIINCAEKHVISSVGFYYLQADLHDRRNLEYPGTPSMSSDASVAIAGFTASMNEKISSVAIGVKLISVEQESFNVSLVDDAKLPVNADGTITIVGSTVESDKPELLYITSLSKSNDSTLTDTYDIVVDASILANAGKSPTVQISLVLNGNVHNITREVLLQLANTPDNGNDPSKQVQFYLKIAGVRRSDKHVLQLSLWDEALQRSHSTKMFTVSAENSEQL